MKFASIVLAVVTALASFAAHAESWRAYADVGAGVNFLIETPGGWFTSNDPQVNAFFDPVATPEGEPQRYQSGGLSIGLNVWATTDIPVAFGVGSFGSASTIFTLSPHTVLEVSGEFDPAGWFNLADSDDEYLVTESGYAVTSAGINAWTFTVNSAIDGDGAHFDDTHRFGELLINDGDEPMDFTFYFYTQARAELIMSVDEPSGLSLLLAGALLAAIAGLRRARLAASPAGRAL